MTVTASSHAGGAKNVRMTVVLRYEMQCAYAGETPIVLTLPGSVPATVASASVLVDGKPTRSATAHGKRLTIAMPVKPQILCDSITRGTLTLVLTRTARIGNPSAAGAYVVKARKGSLAFSARLTVV